MDKCGGAYNTCETDFSNYSTNLYKINEDKLKDFQYQVNQCILVTNTFLNQII